MLPADTTLNTIIKPNQDTFHTRKLFSRSRSLSEWTLSHYYHFIFHNLEFMEYAAVKWTNSLSLSPKWKEQNIFMCLIAEDGSSIYLSPNIGVSLMCIVKWPDAILPHLYSWKVQSMCSDSNFCEDKVICGMSWPYQLTDKEEIVGYS